MSEPTPAPVRHPKDAAGTPKKRLLALDGGGIRGMIAIEILDRIETLLRDTVGRGRADFVLADYFDYVAGTSTGGIIAACISLGMPVKKIRDFYEANGAAMFNRARIWNRLRYKFGHEKLAATLRGVFNTLLPEGEYSRAQPDLTLGSAALKTLLLLVMRNATTDSPWPVSNNPLAKYNDRARPDDNCKLPLWQLVRASTAAPTFFPPEEMYVGDHRFLFVDGGVTMYNNPAFLLFRMATMSSYRLAWRATADDMLLVSIGTGAAAMENQALSPSNLHLLYNAKSLPSALMYAAMNEQDTLCRVFGRCVAGDKIDSEIETLRDEHAETALVPKLFTYARYNADLSRKGLDALGLPRVEPKHVQQLDSVAHMEALQAVGRAAAERFVDAKHFEGFR